MLSSSNDDYMDFINEKLMEYLPGNRSRSGDSIIFRCPFCGDSAKNRQKKRGYYTPKKGLYHCFNCDVSMSGLKLLEKLSGSDFEDIRSEYIRMKVNVEGGKKFNSLPINTSEHEKKFSFEDLVQVVSPKWKVPLSDKAKKYLNGRMVLQAPFLKEGLYSYISKNGLEYILIPWRMNGLDCYYQLNDFQKLDKMQRKYIFPKLTKPVYGLDNIDISFPYIICFEGVYDSLFVKNGICIGGKTLTDYQREILSRRYPKHQIVLSYDNDVPGLTSVKKAIKKDPNGFKFFKWYNENTKEKDVNDYILKVGDPNVFSDRGKVESMIISPIQMRMFLAEKGLDK